MPGCSRKHIFQPHNICSSAGCIALKWYQWNRRLSRESTERHRRLYDEKGLKFWSSQRNAMSSVSNYHHAHFCQNISEVTNQLPIFPPRTFPITVILYSFGYSIPFSLGIHSASIALRKGSKFLCASLPSLVLTKIHECVNRCGEFPYARRAHTSTQIVVHCIVKLAGHGVLLFVGTSWVKMASGRWRHDFTCSTQ